MNIPIDLNINEYQFGKSKLNIQDIKIEESDESLLKIANYMQQRPEGAPIQVTVLRAGKIVTLGRLK